MSRQPSPAGLRTSSTAFVEWRRECLLAAGFDEDLAARLGADDRIDLHALLLLVDRGCPPALAERILAPLDGDRPPSRHE
jgi:hypothetical protein